MAIVAMRRSQIGVQPDYTTAVAPSRQLQGVLAIEDARNRVLRDERRASMGGPIHYDDLSYGSRGTYTGRAVVDELVYLLCAAMGRPAPTGTTWIFDLPLSGTDLTNQPLVALTGFFGEPQVESYRAGGLLVERLVITGTDRAAWTVSADLHGRQLEVGSGVLFDLNTAFLTPDLPSIKTLLSPFKIGSTAAGVAVVPGTIFSFTLTYTSGIVQEYTMGASLDPSSTQRDIPTVTLEVIGKFNTAIANEFPLYQSADVRYIQLSGTNVTIDGAYVLTGFLPLDAERDGTQLSRLTYTGIEVPAPGWGDKLRFTLNSTVAASDIPAPTTPALDEDVPVTAMASRKKTAKAGKE